ncbi:NADH:flavin oxidoreductase [Sphingomonas bacterium]|uniref:NADH:flavin oxidoreductase n=1 Tax=Sphingomonas bacterium TaxID=1895847 RepID=UPI00157616C9|nr:NADH:flavin oxidoreductase [Sphingomonas bacterium]
MPSSDLDILFQPVRLGSLELKNRIVMAPMTRSFSPGGVPGEDVAAYYRRRAEGEVGLILSEGVVVERPSSKNDERIPHLYGEAALAGWRRVVEEVHAAGGRMGPQIWHVGSVANPMTEWLPGAEVESPSGLMAPGATRGRAMSEEDVADTIDAFGRAAADARRLGFDVVEIHGAHGYLIDQFFWAETNTRDDLFGGATVRERTRFAAEVVRSVRAAVGPDFPVILRLSQWKQQDYAARLAETPDALSEWLVPLVEAGADVLHCSQRRFWEPEFSDIDGEGGLNFAGWAKKLTGAKTISVGSVGLSGDMLGAFMGESSTPSSLDNLVHRLEREEFDLIAVGRALLTDPDWVRKVRTGDAAGLRSFAPADMMTLS